MPKIYWSEQNFTGPTKKSENCSTILDNYEIENPREVREITSE